MSTERCSSAEPQLPCLASRRLHFVSSLLPARCEVIGARGVSHVQGWASTGDSCFTLHPVCLLAWLLVPVGLGFAPELSLELGDSVRMDGTRMELGSCVLLFFCISRYRYDGPTSTWGTTLSCHLIRLQMLDNQ